MEKFGLNLGRKSLGYIDEEARRRRCRQHVARWCRLRRRHGRAGEGRCGASPAPRVDLAFGVTGTSDYLFRASANQQQPGHPGLCQLQLLDWVYFNVWASNQNWVATTMEGLGYQSTNSSLEVDFSRRPAPYLGRFHP